MFGALRAAAAAALLLGSVHTASAQDSTTVDLSGNWSFTVVYEGGQGTPAVRLSQKGDTLTGRYISQVFGELEVTGTVKGKEFNFGFTTSAGGDSFTMTFNGMIESREALKGSVDMGGMGSGTFTARRSRDPAATP
jgi:hypothetical protein